MSRSLRVLLTVLATTLAALLLPAEASAFEHQWHAGAGAGYALWSNESSYHGFGGDLHLAYGVNDSFNAMVEAGAVDLPSGNALLFHGSLGAAYLLDVLEWVPYVGVMGGLHGRSLSSDACTKNCTGLGLGVTVPVGLDYQFSRDFAVGLAARYHVVFDSNGTSGYLTTFVRAEMLWGY